MTRHVSVLPEAHRPRRPSDPQPEPPVWLDLAWLAAAWDRVWPAMWPVATLAGLVLALAWLDVLPALGGTLHLGILAALGLAILAAGAIGLHRLRWPDREAARRRLERDSGLEHRPLSGLLDHQVGGAADPASRLLWRLHRERQQAAARRLRVRLPSPGVAALDPLALRGLVLLLLLVAGIGAWGHWGERLGRALSPRLPVSAAAASAGVDLVITPPAYTGLAPIYLRTGTGATAGGGAAHGDEPIAIPAGSTALARVTGGDTPPVLAVGDQRTPFEPVEAGASASFQLGTTITAGSRISVSQGGTVLGAWPIRVVADTPPSVALAEAPAPTPRAALRLAYRVADDYSVESLTATIRLAESAAPALRRGEPMVLPLTLPGQRPRQADATSYLDLTPHPWAGQPVTLELEATDGAGQTGRSETVSLVLPERTFSHPVAQAIIAERRTLMLEPPRYAEVAEALTGLALEPDRFNNDAVVFLALRSAARRLMLARDIPATVEPVQRLLWDTALRLEDGDLSLAERDLRAAEQALRDALAGNASDQEVRQRMDELRSALDRYLQALQRNLMDRIARGEQPPDLPVDPNGTVIDREQLQQLLDRMQRLSESGARDAARDMLTQLQSLMENLRTGNSGEMSEQDSRAMELLRNLQELTRQQQELLDQTYRQSQQQEGAPRRQRPTTAPGQRPASPPPSPSPDGNPANRPDSGAAPDSAAQEALRRALGEAMREAGEMTGEVPVPLGRAEQAMRRSERALGEGQPGQAVQPQTEAVSELQEGLRSLTDQLMEQMAQRGLMGLTGGQGMNGRDPLGRARGNRGGIDTGDVHIPSEGEVQRAREILDELRRRLGQRDRPTLERDYIQRLLRQF